MNLATTSAAQLISRSQSVSSPSATTLTQSVLLGNTSSPPLNQSQAQMYLRVRDVHPLLSPLALGISRVSGPASARWVLLCVQLQGGDLESLGASARASALQFNGGAPEGWKVHSGRRLQVPPLP